MNDYGTAMAADDVFLQAQPGDAEAGASNEVNVDASQLLWEYFHSGSINGVKVENEATGLPVDREDMLLQAMDLVRRPFSEVLLIKCDGDGIKRYNELLDRAYANEIVIVDETRQFVPEQGGFLLWIRYDEVSYKLNPRYAFLKTE